MTFRLTASEFVDQAGGWLEFGWLACNFCTARVPDEGSAELIDHIVPLHHGGSNDPTNLQILCISCNSSKGARI